MRARKHNISLVPEAFWNEAGRSALRPYTTVLTTDASSSIPPFRGGQRVLLYKKYPGVGNRSIFYYPYCILGNNTCTTYFKSFPSLWASKYPTLSLPYISLIFVGFFPIYYIYIRLISGTTTEEPTVDRCWRVITTLKRMLHAAHLSDNKILRKQVNSTYLLLPYYQSGREYTAVVSAIEFCGKTFAFFNLLFKI